MEVEPERFTRELDLTVVGAHRLVRAFVPGMVERRRGDVVFVSSDCAVRPRPFMAAYSAGKWGLEGMVASLQMELEGTGVRAGVVRPGPTWSEMGDDWDPDDAAFVLEQWVQVRAGPTPALPEAKGRRRRDRDGRRRAARRAPQSVEVSPEAPISTEDS